MLKLGIVLMMMNGCPQGYWQIGNPITDPSGIDTARHLAYIEDHAILEIARTGVITEAATWCESP